MIKIIQNNKRYRECYLCGAATSTELEVYGKNGIVNLFPVCDPCIKLVGRMAMTVSAENKENISKNY